MMQETLPRFNITELLISIILLCAHLFLDQFRSGEDLIAQWNLCILSFILGASYGARHYLKLFIFSALVLLINIAGLLLHAWPKLNTADNKFNDIYLWWSLEVAKSLGLTLASILIFYFIGLFFKKKILARFATKSE